MRSSRLLPAFVIASFAIATAPSIAQEPVETPVLAAEPGATPEPSALAADQAQASAPDNAVIGQQNSNILWQASTTQGVGGLEAEQTPAKADVEEPQ